MERHCQAKLGVGEGRFEFHYRGAGNTWLDEAEASERNGDNAVLVVPAA